MGNVDDRELNAIITVRVTDAGLLALLKNSCAHFSLHGTVRCSGPGPRRGSATGLFRFSTAFLILLANSSGASGTTVLLSLLASSCPSCDRSITNENPPTVSIG